MYIPEFKLWDSNQKERVKEVESRTPKFCNICGSRLSVSGRTTGFDPFTGDPLQVNNLICTNPTVKVVGNRLRSQTETIYHPSWSQDADGVWAQ